MKFSPEIVLAFQNVFHSLHIVICHGFSSADSINFYRNTSFQNSVINSFLAFYLAVIPARILEIDNTVSAAPAHSCTNISFVSSSPSQYLRKYIFEFYIHKNLSLYIYKRRGHKIQPPHQNFFNFFIISLLCIPKFHIILKISREPIKVL